MAEVEKERERWSSKTAFYFTAVGAAVGVSLLWQQIMEEALSSYHLTSLILFKSTDLLALFVIGIPLLILEISLGQYYQTGDVGVFGSFHRRWRGVGLSSVACAYMVVTYYSVLIAWVIHAFFDSFGDEAPWAKEDVTGAAAITYFLEEIIGTKTVKDDGLPTRMIGPNVGYSFLTWFLIWGCLAGGTKWTGRITYFTMGFPIVLLFVFLGRAVSLDGSEDGIKEYIGIWDMSVLTERPDCWSTAVSQIFFSIGVTFGIMTAFGSYNERNEPAVLHSCVIAVANSMFSFITGFAVFAAMGHLAFIEGVAVKDLELGGFSLVFGTWPVVFGTLPGGIHMVRLLFFDLFLLGIDSGFGLIEGCLTAAADTVFLSKYSKAQLAGGLNFLDVVDFYINFVLLLVGFFETFAAGWIYGLEEQVAEFGALAVFSYFAANFGSVILACGLWFGVAVDNAVWAGFVGLILFYVAGMGVTGFLLTMKMNEKPGEYTLFGIFFKLGFGNIMDLRDKLSSQIGYLPGVWAFLMKQIIPHIILILFINLARSEYDETGPVPGKSRFGHYGGYTAWPYQILGYGAVIFAFFLFLVGLVVPDVYNGLTLVDEKTFMEEDISEVPFKAVNVGTEKEDKVLDTAM
eukprot:scaffold3169_cov277-Chaetoceros_neogracile.AAC.2